MSGLSRREVRGAWTTSLGHEQGQLPRLPDLDGVTHGLRPQRRDPQGHRHGRRGLRDQSARGGARRDTCARVLRQSQPRESGGAAMSRYTPSFDVTRGWAQRLWDSLADNGQWGIPRSGLILVKDEAGKRLIVAGRMPWDGEMEGIATPEELREDQNREIEGVRKCFAVIGIEVVDVTPIVNEVFGEEA